MMFRLLPAAAMTATALAAMTAGAATVDVYGVVDTGLHYVKADSGDTSVTMASKPTSPALASSRCTPSPSS